MVEVYKESMKKIPCKYFIEERECPFGSVRLFFIFSLIFFFFIFFIFSFSFFLQSCFYAHARPESILSGEPEEGQRLMVGADGVRVRKQFTLAAFLDT